MLLPSHRLCLLTEFRVSEIIALYATCSNNIVIDQTKITHLNGDYPFEAGIGSNSCSLGASEVWLTTRLQESLPYEDHSFG